MEITREQLQAHIREKMKQEGPPNLAARLGVTLQTLYNYRKGATLPDFVILKLLGIKMLLPKEKR